MATRKLVTVGAGTLVTAGLLGATFAAYGRDGVELLSWIAGVLALAVAVLTIYLTANDGAPPSGFHRFSARADRDSRVYQAGNDIRVDDR